MPLLPQRPLRLSPRFVRGAYLTAAGLGAPALLLIGGALLWQGPAAASLLREQRIWGLGLVADQAIADGEERTPQSIFGGAVPLRDYEFRVVYRDDTGATHHGEARFSALGARVDRDSQPQVRYDPAAPGDFALSWGIDVAGGRWGAISFWLAAAALAAGLLGAGAALTLRELKDARRAAALGEERALEVIATAPARFLGIPTGGRRYRYRLPAAPGGAPAEDELVARDGPGGPLFTDESRRYLVALVSPDAPTRPLLLRDDRYPLAESE